MNSVAKMGGFRELSTSEIAMVSGGFSDDDNIIVVIGERPDPWITSIYLDDLLDVGLDFSDLIGPEVNPFEDHGDGGEQEQCPQQSSSEAEQTESAAQTAQALINEKAKDGNEHGYFIIRDSDRNITLGAYHQGDDDEIDFGGDGLSLSETGASSWENVVGSVHNHTPNQGVSFGPNSNDRIDKYNRTPSEGDWQILDGINGVNENENFTLYIMDKDGKLRAYDADSDRGKNSATDVIEPEGDHQCSST